VLVKEFFYNRWTFGKVTGKMVDCFICPIRLKRCPQRCKTRQISKIICVWWTETVANCCHINRQINVSLLSTNITLMLTAFDLLTDRLMPSVTDWLLVMYSILLQHLYLSYCSCVGLQWVSSFLTAHQHKIGHFSANVGLQSTVGFLYGQCELVLFWT